MIINEEELAKAKSVISYLQAKKSLNSQESFDMLSSLITVLFSRVEHLEAEVRKLKYDG